MNELMAFLFAIATGLVAAGLCSSFHRLVTSKPPSFQLWECSVAAQVAGVVTLLFAGPAVIMRNAFRAHVIENRPPLWLLISMLIALMWSFLSGILLLNVFFAR